MAHLPLFQVCSMALFIVSLLSKPWILGSHEQDPSATLSCSSPSASCQRGAAHKTLRHSFWSVSKAIFVQKFLLLLFLLTSVGCIFSKCF